MGRRRLTDMVSGWVRAHSNKNGTYMGISPQQHGIPQTYNLDTVRIDVDSHEHIENLMAKC